MGTSPSAVDGLIKRARQDCGERRRQAQVKQGLLGKFFTGRG